MAELGSEVPLSVLVSSRQPIRLLLLPDTKVYPAGRQAGYKAACRELPGIVFGRLRVMALVLSDGRQPAQFR